MKHVPRGTGSLDSARELKVFASASTAFFAASYPEKSHRLRHALPDNPLLGLEALAQLGESLPQRSVEYNRGDVPIGITEKPGSTGLTIGETIRAIDTANSWAVLKNIEQNPAYKALLLALLDELKPEIEAKTGKMLRPQGFIFVSSPGAVTPYHFDPEHNILLQLRGTKDMTVFPAGDPDFVSDDAHETYHTGGGRELNWNPQFQAQGTRHPLHPGDALYVPVMAPHFVKVGTQPAISLSITWRSEWSFAEADARSFNRHLRRFGLKPNPPGRWPQSNRGKALAWRILRNLGLAPQ